jgi:hypothetical protein
MSLRGTRSGPAFRSDGRGLAFVTGNDRGRVAPAAVGKPDKTPLFDPVRKHFWAPGTILRALQSYLQTALQWINRSPIAKPPAQYDVCRQMKWRICKDLPTVASQCLQFGRRHRARFLFPIPSSTRRDEYYRGALRPRSGDFSFPRSEFRTTEA